MNSLVMDTFCCVLLMGSCSQLTEASGFCWGFGRVWGDEAVWAAVPLLSEEWGVRATVSKHGTDGIGFNLFIICC